MSVDEDREWFEYIHRLMYALPTDMRQDIEHLIAQKDYEAAQYMAEHLSGVRWDEDGGWTLDLDDNGYDEVADVD